MPIITTYYKNLFSKKRQVKERYIVDENGIKNGLYQSYHRNGLSSETCEFKNGIKNGFCVIKHDNGRVATECTYQDGCLEGDYVSYYADGHKRLECSFKQDRTHGVYRLFNPKGELEILYTYHHGKKHGPCEIRCSVDEVEKIQYQHDEIIKHEVVQNSINLKVIKTFEQGQLKTHVKSHYTPDGLLKEQIVYSPDFKVSQHEIYADQVKTPHIKFTCINGQKDGEYLRFAGSLFPIEVSHYKSDKLHGTRKLYFEGLDKPILKEEATYQAGKLDGLYVRYHQDGKIAEKALYRMGKKVVHPEHIQTLFEKQADADNRDKVATNIVSLRRLGKRTEAMVVAQKFHLEKSDIPRRTALKMDKQKSRV